jgi:hypothetical protein
VLKTGASATTAVTIGSDQSVTFAGSQTFSGGTANGVLYLNGSKAVTSGSALTFDGTNFANTGNITAGTTSSGANLVAYASTYTANGMVRLFGTDGNNKVEFGAASATTAFLTARSGVSMIFGANDAEQMRLTSTGLGIGTSSPSAKLSLEGAGTYLLTLNNTAQDARIRLLYNGTEGGQISASATTLNVVGTSSIGFRTNGSLVGTWDSSGNLGLGVTPSAWALSGSKAMQIVNAGFSGYLNNAYMTANQYFTSTGGSNYIANGFASMYIQQSGQHQFFTAASGTAGNSIAFTQAMILDASGNLGIGVTAQSISRLDVIAVGSAESNAGLQVRSYLAGTSDGSTTVTAIRAVNSSAGNWANTRYHAYSHQWGIGGSASTSTAMTLDSSGNLLVGATSFSSGGITKTIVSAGSSSAGFQIQLAGNVAAYIYGYTSGSTGYRIETTTTYPRIEMVPGSSGGVQLTSGATSWTSLSDERTKTDLVPITDAVQKVSSLRAVTGRFIKDDPETSRSFLIAQDFVDVFPQAVSTFKEKDDDTEYLGLAYTDTIPLLVAAIKEQQAIIQKLQADVAALKGTA